VGWVLGHDVPKPTRYARDLLADPLLRRLGRHYPACVALGLALPAGLAWAVLGGWAGALFGLYWGGVLRIALGHHVIWAINSCCHLVGTRPNATRDSSTNVAALALLSWGESWHNNHHAQPTAAQFGRGWRQPDIGWWVVRAFVALGWARLRGAAD
jgi:stearoyl-CoA desaturase (delta-9 desaturase)